MEDYNPQEYAGILLRAVEHLSDRQATIFLLQTLGMNKQQIACKMNLKDTTIKNEFRAINNALFLIRNRDDVIAFLIHEVFCPDK